MEKFGERVSISNSYDKFLRIHVKDGELVPQFNIRFARVLNEIPESYRFYDQMCLVIYFDAFDKKMNYLLRDKEPQTLYQAFVTTRDIENNLKYGLVRGHFSMNECQYNGHERKVEHSVDIVIPYQNINTPTIMNNQIENLDQNVCVEKNEFIANRDTYVHDATVVRNILDFDNVQHYIDFMDQGLVTIVSSSHDNQMYNDVTNASKFKVSTPRYQSYASEEAQSYLSDHELDVSDPTCHEKITQDEECELHLSQSQSEEQSAYVCNVSVVDGKIDSLDQLDMQEMNSLIERLHYVENVIKLEVDRYASQYQYKEAKSYLPSDKGEVANLVYYEEVSCEDNDES